MKHFLPVYCFQKLIDLSVGRVSWLYGRLRVDFSGDSVKDCATSTGFEWRVAAEIERGRYRSFNAVWLIASARWNFYNSRRTDVARIAGVNIPTNKRVVIALQYIHGIGPKFAREIVTKVGIADDRRVNQLVGC